MMFNKSEIVKILIQAIIVACITALAVYIFR